MKIQNENLKLYKSCFVKKAEILYMSALHARLSGQPGEEVIGLLNDAVDAHFKERSII